ncbi:HAD-IIB family hydrolase [Raoultella ornithinolytica]|uniref:HAD-IIB family hydrolase n=1 Tax=Raoultella ornithinolytica TaxID=54291 RepID=UPI000CA02F53|nr:HAD-IIB family hydrolase [Raoultella ornithinolytica]MBK2610525.1 HAD-IIB family hydrolase [Raoultella ornithinolytica]MCF6661369.1 HAD-IIB family hydrolase [Raoultella ornithinolytica]MDE5424840.1 HAD-IIB family hydrolase [Raoultella ornithinolytica]MDU0919147.1 HAD-IIB family hydrolase [Raoultella ornithinolytica]QLK15826.1 HAD-IIB family hydrolase [Raoultella ornithinolytica]
MRPLALASQGLFSSVQYVLTDMDETLTFRGRLSAATYAALERLQSAGIRVIPVTGAPAGWCDQMVRMWPVDGVIGENGGFFFQRAADGHGVNRYFWYADKQADVQEKLAAIARKITEQYRWATLAADQPFRLSGLAFDLPAHTAHTDTLRESLHEAGLKTTVNNLWVLAWSGEYDKLIMSRHVLRTFYHLDERAGLESVFYSGDSENDAPMFAGFRHTLGMSTLRHHLATIPALPAWISVGPGGDGFIEGVDKILEHKTAPASRLNAGL